MLRTMVAFGITENLQVSASAPIFMRDGDLGPARMMTAMSSERDVEGLVGYRFHHRALGVGARHESTVYVGGTIPLDAARGGGTMPATGSLEVSGATGYASRAHYLWVGGGLQQFADRDGNQPGQARFMTAVYGYRPAPLRADGAPDLRFFVEATAEDRAATRAGGMHVGSGSRTVFVGPTALFLHGPVGIEGGVLFPAYQRADPVQPRERMRVAVDVSYFFWIK